MSMSISKMSQHLIDTANSLLQKAKPVKQCDITTDPYQLRSLAADFNDAAIYVELAQSLSQSRLDHIYHLMTKLDSFSRDRIGRETWEHLLKLSSKFKGDFNG